MPFYVADYLGDTRHLSTEQHGAYLLLLMAMWRAGGTLPDDHAKLARIVGLSAVKWARISADVLEFFDTSNGVISHGRVQKEIEKYSQKSIIRRQSGARGGAAKALKNNNTGVANATILLEQKPSISEPELEPDKHNPLTPYWGDDCRLDFERAVKAYPIAGRATVSPEAMEAAWFAEIDSGANAKDLAQAAVAFASGGYAEAGGRVPRFDRWLSKGLWRSVLTTDEGASSLIAWSGPMDVREAIVAAHGDTFARAYFDPCAWQDVPDRVIVPRTGVAAAKLKAEALETLTRCGVQIAPRSAA
jgi:uncharacterized protein YdaU (DUF1376 family)